jgi:hypothetical protein
MWGSRNVNGMQFTAVTKLRKKWGAEEKNEGHELHPNSCQEVSEIPSKIDKVVNLYFTMTVAG